ncbi:CDC27 [Bugula neritina]|uniref:Cell division cycle protein 27 homolog n=1 Tax=Bugula neritina TaxID=10212 RepID=A0A7J7KT24_BUGNE|nr:CDC27 [Bugula neritina]
MSHEVESTAFHTPANGSNSGFSASSPPMVGKLFISELHDKQTLISPSFGTLPLDTPIAGTYDSSFATPAFAPISFKDIPSAPTKKVTCAADSQPMVSPASVSRLVFGKSSTSNTTKPDMLVVPSPTAYHTNLSIPRRRSKRILDSQSSSSVKENSKMQTRGSHTSLRSTIRKARSNQNIKLSDEVTSKNKYNSSIKRPSTTATSTVEALDIKQKQSASAFLSLLRDLGAAYLASHTFDIKKCVDLFEAVPSHHYKTGWVLAEAGRAYLEMAEYHKAREVFDELRKLEPHQINGMETYSTVLFHLQDEVALSTLAQDMVEIDKHCAQTWCVNGNCFSLQKEHETAIKFLQRAIQIDPCFTYAYTLLGHEYTITEDYDKAMSAFRNAIRVDSRHYNAWYGLGMIFYKREKFTLAEAHFKKALLINPQSAVLLCHIGLVQHALQKHVLALETLNQAVEMSPRNPMCLFHRASMLVANDKLEQALKELESLKALTPKESLVYFLIGKVHKKLGNAHLSMLNFSWATDLDPKGANNHIKEAIDRRYVTDEEDQEHSLSVDASILMADTPSETLSTDTSVMDSDEAHHHLQANESDDSL